MLFQRRLQRAEAPRAHLVHAAAEHLVDEVFLAAEVVVDGGDVDVGAAGDLAQRGAGEPVLGEQFLGGAEDAVLGGKMGGGHGRGRFGGVMAATKSNACLNPTTPTRRRGQHPGESKVHVNAVTESARITVADLSS